MTSSFLDMFMTKPVQEWTSHIGGLYINLPSRYTTFGAIVANTLTLAFPDIIVDVIAPLLMDVFGLSSSQRTFLLQQYIPEVK
jgi:hypothetical protein